MPGEEYELRTGLSPVRTPDHQSLADDTDEWQAIEREQAVAAAPAPGSTDGSAGRRVHVAAGITRPRANR